ncbi:MAG: RNA polymerase sigma factor [Pseudomonadales bacterium]|nr:RNA polymerase sigma factor [Pseudomonadales bacterium]
MSTNGFSGYISRGIPLLRETEEELVRSAQTGNIAAFERLVRTLERQMLAVAAGFAHTPDDANDIYQDAMLAAYKALPNFKLESKFSTWLHKIVVNTALSNRRKLKRTWQKMAAVQTEYEQQEKYVDSHDPESSMLDEELSGEIAQALNKLTDSERIAFVLCHQQGFKLREAAEVMGCSDNSIKVMLFRAWKKMQEQLVDYH